MISNRKTHKLAQRLYGMPKETLRRDLWRRSSAVRAGGFCTGNEVLWTVAVPGLCGLLPFLGAARRARSRWY